MALDWTQAILAFAGLAQAGFAWGLLRLQRKITDVQEKQFRLQSDVEELRHRVEIFMPLKLDRLSQQHGWSVILYIGNLSNVGVWLESVSVILDPDRGPRSRIKSIDSIVPAYNKHVEDIGDVIRSMMSDRGSQNFSGHVECELTYWALGNPRPPARTKRYSVVFDYQSGVCQLVEPARN